MNFALIIPTYLPNNEFLELINSFSKLRFSKIIIINDGSGKNYSSLFEEITKINKVKVLTHHKNKGKGAALKTGFLECINNNNFEGVITADADGQHSVSDVQKLLELFRKNHRNIILGSRRFSGSVPFRSRFGNIITNLIFKIIFRKTINDTQTGLRALPINFCRDIVYISSNGYEFEMDMLIKAVRSDYKILEQEIQTIYIDNNKSSHFNPLIDSMKIYFALLRFSLSSLITYLIDYTVFIVCYQFSENIGLSTMFARSVALPIYLFLNYEIVFRVNPFKMIMLIKLIISVIITGYISYYCQLWLSNTLDLNISIGKIIVESILFFLSFFIMRDFIFTKENVGKKVI